MGVVCRIPSNYGVLRYPLAIVPLREPSIKLRDLSPVIAIWGFGLWRDSNSLPISPCPCLGEVPIIRLAIVVVEGYGVCPAVPLCVVDNAFRNLPLWVSLVPLIVKPTNKGISRP